MTNHRMSGLALIAGSVAGIITMSHHPTAEDLFAPSQLAPTARMLSVVHALAPVSLPVLFLGALVLWRRLGSNDGFAIAGLVLYAFATVAVMNAAVFDGLVTASIVPQIAAGTPATSEGWRIAFTYNGQLNQAFARVFRGGFDGGDRALVGRNHPERCARSRARVVRMCSRADHGVRGVPGHLRLDPHGFGLIVLGQAVWFISAGAQLCRVRNA